MAVPAASRLYKARTVCRTKNEQCGQKEVNDFRASPCLIIHIAESRPASLCVRRTVKQ